MTTWGEVARQVEQLSDRCDAFFARRAAQKADKIARNATKRVDKARRDEEHRETIENPDDPGPIGQPLVDREQKSPPGYSHGEWRNI